MNKVVSVAGAMAVALVLASAVLWCRAHPFGTSWDEYGYFLNVREDVDSVQQYGRWGATDRFFHGDRERPPGYRLAAFPFAEVVGTSPTQLRVLSLLGLLLGAGLIYTASRRFASVNASVASAVFFALSYAPMWASMHFGMEYVLYPALAGLYYAALRIIDKGVLDGRSAWMLALALAIGALSKTSFAFVALPVCVVLLGLLIARKVRVPSVVALVLPVLFTIACVVPWWLMNFRQAFDYATYSSGFSRHHFPWWQTAYRELLGPGFAILLLLMTAAGVSGFFAREKTSSAQGSLTRMLPILCLASILPLLVTHVLGQNHNMRLVSPVLVPLALLVALAFDLTSPKLQKPLAVAAALIMLLQAGVLANRFHVQTVDQWDWAQLRAECVKHGFDRPRLAHLGNGGVFNPAAIEYPWVENHTPVHDVWLWRYESGPIDWSRVSLALEKVDVVVTAPTYLGDPEDKQDLDNQHNAGLVRSLADSKVFSGPVILQMGQEHIPVYVYFRRTPGQVAAGS